MATLPVMDTFVSGERVTAAKLNKNVRDAANFLLTPPTWRAFRSAALSPATATVTAMPMDGLSVDTDNMNDANGFTCVTAGLYRIDVQTLFVGNATGARYVEIRDNGAVVALNRTHVSSAQTAGVTTQWVGRLSVGDAISFAVWQNSGGALAVTTGSSNTYASAQWIGK